MSPAYDGNGSLPPDAGDVPDNSSHLLPFQTQNTKHSPFPHSSGGPPYASAPESVPPEAPAWMR